MAKPKRSSVNSSATHVFEVLRFVATNDEPRGVTEIARRLSLPVSTVFRALSTLEEADYIRRYQNAPRFEIGNMAFLLSRALLSRFALHNQSRDLLYGLASATEETVSLWMKLGWYAVLIGGAFGRRDTFHNVRLGDTMLLHEHPAGRTILNPMPAAERRRYERFIEANFPGRAIAECSLEQTVSTSDDIRNEKSGALDFRTCGLPVRDEAGRFVGALTCEGLDSPDAMPGDRLRATRDEIEAIIAGDPVRYRSPFAHIPDDEIKIDIEASQERT